VGALDLVKQLRGVRYRWKPVEEREVRRDLKLPIDEAQIGFIAQEVERVVPEAVIRPADTAESVYGLKETNLLPLLVEALKEQQTQIESLRQELAALKAAPPAMLPVAAIHH